jgi:hypothetical protein
LQHFGKIGTGDIVELASEIEKDREKIQRGEEVSGQGNVTDEGIRSPLVSITSSAPSSHCGHASGTEDVQPLELTKRSDGEGDVKMEDT